MESASKTSPFSSRQARVAAGTLGMRLFLLSLGVLFGASVIGYVAIRVLAIGHALELPGLPPGLWLSTLLLVVSSVTMQMGLAAVRQGRPRRLRQALTATAVLGLGFLVVQTACWLAWAAPMQEALGATERMFLLKAFYVLTGLHALHVIGGLVPLTVVTSRAWAGRYTSQNHDGVVYTAMYWHFLDAVWLVLFATLMIGT